MINSVLSKYTNNKHAMKTQSNNNTMESPEEIVRIFSEAALKPEKCIDFDIKYVSEEICAI